MFTRRFAAAIVAFASIGLAGTSPGHASQFDVGDVFRAGFTTLTAPPDLAAAAALLGAANDRTVNNNPFGEFSLGTSLSVDLNVNSIFGFCLVSQDNCAAMNNPADPSFFGLIISDTAVPGGSFEDITNVTSAFLAPGRIFFDANTIVLDLSGLLFPTWPASNLLATVEFAEPGSEVPLPAALPLFAAGLGVVSLLARRKRSRAQAAA